MAREDLSKKELNWAKENLADLEMYIEDFSSFLPIAVCVVSPIGVIINVNKSFESLSGYKNIETAGTPIINVFSQKKKVEKILNETWEKEIIQGRELILLSKKGKKIPVSVSLSTRKDREGNFIGYFIGIINITELKRLQEEMEEKIKERTKDLQRKIEELEVFQKLVVGRELKMIELKREIEKLKKQLEK